MASEPANHREVGNRMSMASTRVIVIPNGLLLASIP